MKRNLLLPALLAAAALLLGTAAACGGGGSSLSARAAAAPSGPPTALGTQVSVYFLRDGKVAAAHRRVPQAQALVGAALRQLRAGPNVAEQQAGLSSAVSGDLSILHVSTRGGTAVVDVGGGLLAGGMRRTLQRLAQLTYTVTQYRMPEIALCQPGQASTCVVVGKQLASRVRFLRDGSPLVLKDSGIDFTKPVSRTTFSAFTPAILVESPTIGERAKSPLLVWGTTTTRGAVLWLQLQTPGGVGLLKQRVVAASRSGTRGMFRTRLSFAPRGGGGQLEAHSLSPAGSSRGEAVAIPLTFAH